MGEVTVTIGVTRLLGEDYVEIDALVDTGAIYSQIPKGILDHAGVATAGQLSFLLADGSHSDMDYGFAMIRLDGEIRPSMVVFGVESGTPLLGVTALENFGLGVDPINLELVSVELRA